MTQTVRLTVGQAVVRFLAQQWTERDGVERRLFPGVYGIFGHGNVCGVGAASGRRCCRPRSRPARGAARLAMRSCPTT